MTENGLTIQTRPASFARQPAISRFGQLRFLFIFHAGQQFQEPLQQSAMDRFAPPTGMHVIGGLAAKNRGADSPPVETTWPFCN